MKRTKNTIPKLFLTLILSILLAACSSNGSSNYDNADDSTPDEDIVRAEGWTEATHSKGADPDYDIVFNQNEVGRIDLTISSNNWQSMMSDENLTSVYGEFGSQSGSTKIPAGGGQPPIGGAPAAVGGSMTAAENPIWVPCTFQFNNIIWNYVGVRFKGNSSLRDTWQKGIYKLPFRFDFDEFEDTWPSIDDQRFYGFKKLTLSSGYKDESLIREKIAADIFRELGVPAPKTSFYRLFIDTGDGQGSKYFGLYTMVEVPGDPMLDSQFATSDGNLYKPDGTTASFGTGTPSETDFDKETNEDEADYSDVNALYTALNAAATDSAAWKTALESVFDVDSFLNWLAVNTTIQNWDTYGIMTHNYYLYNDNGLLTWVPWDNNESQKGSDAASGGHTPLSLELNEASLSSWPLISRIIEQPDYLATYKTCLQATVTNHFNPATMDTLYQNAHDLIYDYVVGVNGELAGYTLLESDDAFINSLDYLNTLVDNRVDAVNRFLGN